VSANESSEVEAAAGDRVPRCRFCDCPATCHGTYEGDTGFACDDCCGHGCEDGHCESIVDICEAHFARLAADRAARDVVDAVRTEYATRLGISVDQVKDGSLASCVGGLLAILSLERKGGGE
jgi:hypothetical protein